jgi:hypothetical protein
MTLNRRIRTPSQVIMKMKAVENQLTITATTLANFTRPVLLALSVRYCDMNQIPVIGLQVHD